MPCTKPTASTDTTSHFRDESPDLLASTQIMKSPSIAYAAYVNAQAAASKAREAYLTYVEARGPEHSRFVSGELFHACQQARALLEDARGEWIESLNERNLSVATRAKRTSLRSMVTSAVAKRVPLSRL